jgi:hypothetical protein
VYARVYERLRLYCVSQKKKRDGEKRKKPYQNKWSVLKKKGR